MGPNGVIKAWPIASRTPHRTTLWRWVNGSPPTDPESILELAGAFDLDPVALFQATPRGYAALCRALLRTVGGKHTSRVTRELEWIFDLIIPAEEWPPRRIATTYFHRQWHLAQFSHLAIRKNYFQKIAITAGERKFGEPQVWHFAFTVPDALLPVWTPYGFVERNREEISLYHVRGYTGSTPRKTNENTFVVETWFGGGTAEFRIASLHPFTAALAEDNESSASYVRFR